MHVHLLTKTCAAIHIDAASIRTCALVGLRWVVLGWIGLGWIGLLWIGLGEIVVGWDGLGWIRLGSVNGLGWVGLDWAGLYWVGVMPHHPFLWCDASPL